AFLWSDNTMIDLNTLLPEDSGWTLTKAAGINANGQIVGQGDHAGFSPFRAFLLSPEENRGTPGQTKPVAHQAAASVPTAVTVPQSPKVGSSPGSALGSHGPATAGPSPQGQELPSGQAASASAHFVPLSEGIERHAKDLWFAGLGSARR